MSSSVAAVNAPRQHLTREFPVSGPSLIGQSGLKKLVYGQISPQPTSHHSLAGFEHRKNY